MTSWPMAADYVRMLQDPKVAFRDRELQQCTIARDANNLPFCISGGFAAVFKATRPDGSNVAIRAFTSERAERTERYRLITEHLDQVRPRVPCLVGFRYDEKGLRVVDSGKGRWFPLMVMDWVSGVTLYEWVGARCRTLDRSRLSRLADRWAELIADMIDAQIAHGDLNHRDVMVTEQDELKLVDYDCMCVPKLVGRRNLELGVVPYQHPDRNGDTKLALSLDDFSSIVICVALRAVAAEPQLWADFVVAEMNGKLLFRQQDFQEPGRSRLIERLRRSPDHDLPGLLEKLLRCYAEPLSAVPSLLDDHVEPSRT